MTHACGCVAPLSNDVRRSLAEMRKAASASGDEPVRPARVQRIRQKAATSSDREYVQGFERGVSVIKTFGAQRPQLTVTEVAAQTGLTRAVARRYLLTLERLGYVAANGPYYALTPRVLEIGFAYMSSMTVAEIARPFMARVVDTLHESCSVGVLDGYDVFYVARTNPQRIMTTNLAIGSRLPAHATAMGHVLLAYLSPPQLEAYLAGAPLGALTDRTITDKAALRRELLTVRRQGWAENDGESEKGVRTVAVPIFDRSGEIVAAINLAGHASRVTMRELRRDHLPVLQQAATEISNSLGVSLPAPAQTLRAKQR